MSKVWKPIPGWAGFYEVSDGGDVRSVDRNFEVLAPGRARHLRYLRGRLLAATESPNGYSLVVLSRPRCAAVHRYIHRLVLLAFQGPCPEGMEVCHNNGIRADNRLENLRYDTRAANARDRVAHGTAASLKGENNPSSKLTDADVRMIRTSKESARSIGRRLGVSHNIVAAARRGTAWAHI
jgi:hypothetical protein